MKPYAESAEQYHANGWHPLPILDMGKGVVPGGFTGYRSTKVRLEDIERWVIEQGLGDRNVCLRLMYEVGIDIDSYDPDKGAREAFEELEAKHGPLPPTVRVSARFGEGYDGLAGIKVFRLPQKYRAMAEVPKWNGQAGSGIDVIRLGHRQVVCWPSIHHKRKTQYQYLDERTGVIIDGPLPPPDTLPEIPDAWVENVLLKPDKPPKAQGAPKGTTSGAPKASSASAGSAAGSQWWTDGSMCKATSKALGKAVTKMHGGRYDAMVKHMLALTRLGEQGHQGVAQAIDSLHGHYIAEVIGDGSRDSTTAESEWERASANVDGVIDSEGLTAAGDKGCCGPKATTHHGGGGIVGNTDSQIAEDIANGVLAPTWKYVSSEPGMWMRWDGRRWRESSTVAVTEVVRVYVRDQVVLAITNGATAAEIAAKAGRCKEARINTIVRLARGVASVRTLPEDWADDRHPYLLNCQNGVVDLRTKTLKPHDPALLLTRITKAAYVPGATHPDWDIARRAFADSDTETYLRMVFGTGCIGRQPAGGALVVLHGGGLNGKSTVTGSVASALGEYAREQLPTSLIGGQFEPRPHEVMELQALRYGQFEETADGMHLNVAALKRIVDTPSMTGSRKYHAQVTFPNTATLVLNTNHRPVVKEADEGTWRRLTMVPFPHRFANAAGVPLDPTLRQRLKDGDDGRAEAVLAWVVEGAHDYLSAGETMGEAPTSVKDATEEWRGSSDLIAQFLSEECTFTFGAFTSSSDLLARFNSWLIYSDNGKHEWSNTLFTQRLESHHLIVAKKVTKGRQRLAGSANPTRGFLGIALVPLGKTGWGGRIA